MSKEVPDASAILALLQDEPGAGLVRSLLNTSSPNIAISSVNLCEVMTRLVREGASPAEVEYAIEPFRSFVVDFDLAQAARTARLEPLTRTAGLSLGDRACIALAESLQGTIWTADRAWSRVPLGVPIRLIR